LVDHQPRAEAVEICEGAKPLSRLSSPGKTILAGGRAALTTVGTGAHVQLQNARHHDDGLRTIAAFVHCKFEGFGATDEKAPAKTFWTLYDPVTVAILTNEEKRASRIA
jgi:hypothetical protein